MDALAKDAHDLTVSTNNPIPVMEAITSYHRPKAVRKRWIVDREQDLRISRLSIVRQQNLSQPLITYLAKRELTTSIIRLRIGHCSLKAHLYRLGLEDSPSCNCGEPETIEHVIIYCPRYYSHRMIFKYRLSSLGIPFQLPRILGSDFDTIDTLKKVFRHLAVFLRGTGLLQRI